jgi:hypothetical protein
VRFEKDITIARAKELAASVPLPYVFHARIASIGRVCPELCHPFPLDKRGSRLRLQGSSPKGVLFHNGTWSAWIDYIDAEPGPWSDSVAMSFIGSNYGIDVLEETVPDTQRLVLLTPRGIRRLGSGWSTLKPGIWASNRFGFDSYAAADPCWMTRTVDETLRVKTSKAKTKLPTQPELFKRSPAVKTWEDIARRVKANRRGR